MGNVRWERGERRLATDLGTNAPEARRNPYNAYPKSVDRFPAPARSPDVAHALKRESL
jgi:hypothetical protein